jgi:hypothetical protein
MTELRPIARCYIALLALATLFATGAGLLATGWPLTERPALAAAFAGLLVLAAAFPLHIADKTKITLDSGVVFAIVLLFEPGPAMLLAGAGVTVAQLVRRDPASQAAFNGAAATLQAAAGALLLAFSGWDWGQLSIGPAVLPALATTALAMFLVNLLAVATIVALQTGASWWSVTRESLGFGALQDVALFALGLFAAVVAEVDPTLLPILLVPALVTYLSLVWHLRARAAARTDAHGSLGRGATLYVAAVAVAALGLLPALRAGLWSLDTAQALTAVALAACVTLAFLYPLALGFRSKLVLDTGVIFAAILLFDPAVAMLVAGAGSVLAHLIRRDDHAQCVFNSAQTMLQAAAGGSLLALVGWNVAGLQHATPAQLAALAGAALLMYLVNTVSVATIIALHEGLPPLAVWRGLVGPADAVERGLQYSLGLAAAATLAASPWLLPAFGLPAVGLYLVLRALPVLRERRARADAAALVAAPPAPPAPPLRPLSTSAGRRAA